MSEDRCEAVRSQLSDFGGRWFFSYISSDRCFVLSALVVRTFVRIEKDTWHPQYFDLFSKTIVRREYLSFERARAIGDPTGLRSSLQTIDAFFFQPSWKETLTTRLSHSTNTSYSTSVIPYI